MVAIAPEHLPGQPPVVGELPLGEIDSLLSGLSFGVARSVGLASYEEVEQGRDDALVFLDFTRVLAPLMRRAFGVPDAFGFGPLAEAASIAIAFRIAWDAALAPSAAGGLDEARTMLDRETPRFAARHELLDQIPERFRGALSDPGLMRGLEDSERAEHTAAIERFEAEHPGLYGLVTASDRRA